MPPSCSHAARSVILAVFGPGTVRRTCGETSEKISAWCVGVGAGDPSRSEGSEGARVGNIFAQVFSVRSVDNHRFTGQSPPVFATGFHHRGLLRRMIAARQ